VTGAIALQDDPLVRAREHIDTHLFEPLSLTALASEARLSAFHFSRAFGARFGFSPMAYVRTRRLATAAERLAAKSAPPLIELAFDCGFDSQEAFTRAFKRVFGVPPGRYRQGEKSPADPLSLPAEHAEIALDEAGAQLKPGIRVAGLRGLFNLENNAGIPRLWERLQRRLPLPGQGGRETYGVCAAAPTRAQPGLFYTAGVALAPDARKPAGLQVTELEPHTYLVFHQTMTGGPVHPQMRAAVRKIWGELLPNCRRTLASAPDIEFYPEDFRPDREGAWVEWWVPVEA
jgi:AraC family transcriptional regulator